MIKLILNPNLILLWYFTFLCILEITPKKRNKYNWENIYIIQNQKSSHIYFATFDLLV